MKKCFGTKFLINNLFVNDINYCLTSSCDSITIHSNLSIYGYDISFRQKSVKYGCQACSVDMLPTGTLSVATDACINPYSDGPNRCTLMFQWSSKMKSVSAPDRRLLKKPKPLSDITIYVDFLPALESVKPSQSLSSAGVDHDYFIVPKGCNVCGYKYRWRKSWCIAEQHFFATRISDKHKRCYIIMKYITTMSLEWPEKVSHYQIKFVVIQHQKKCLDISNNTVDCVIEMYRDLLQAYESQELLSHHSNLNIFAQTCNMDFWIRCRKSLYLMCTLAETDSWENFVSKADEMYADYSDNS